MSQFEVSTSRLVQPLAGGLAVWLFVWAAVAGSLGRAQMASKGVICGAAVPHCGWCYAAVALVLAATTCLAMAFLPPAKAAIPARSSTGL
jgi:hypothetical protein